MRKLMRLIISIIIVIISTRFLVYEYFLYFSTPYKIFGIFNAILIIYLLFKKIFEKKLNSNEQIYLEIIYFISLIAMLFGRKIGLSKIVFDLEESFQYITLKEIVLNVILFVPLGYISQKNKFIIIFPYILIIIIESLQYYFKVGIFDISDIIFNFLGVTIGMIIFLIEKRKICLKDLKKKKNI